LRRWRLEEAQVLEREDEFRWDVRHALDDAIAAFVRRGAH
jgi:hypothetical protein